jgi:hypothetical protein
VRPFRYWDGPGVLLPADCGRDQTRGARALGRKAGDSIVTAIGVTSIRWSGLMAVRGWLVRKKTKQGGDQSDRQARQ